MNFVNTDNITIKKLFTKLPEDTAIGEFSGRDSVAAIIKSLEQPNINNILPVASFAGVEYGSAQVLKDNHEYTAKRIESFFGKEKKLFPLIFYSKPDLWSVINARFTSLIIKKFGFYTPCIGCHAYFHILRVPMALKLGKIIISGERESHDGKVKVNQFPSCLSFYKKVLSDFGIQLIMPLQYTKTSKEIENILGSSWKEGKNHPQCVFSENYKDMKGNIVLEEKQVDKYLEEFLEPALTKITALLIQSEDTDKKELIKQVEDLW